jgi:hypothetical protein
MNYAASAGSRLTASVHSDTHNQVDVFKIHHFDIVATHLLVSLQSSDKDHPHF